MLIVIRTGKDRKEHNALKERVRDLEGAVEDLRNGISVVQNDMIDFERELSAEDARMIDDHDRRLNNLDAWKADRHHTHKDADAAAPE